PVLPALNPSDGVPLLAPIGGSPQEPLPAPRPMPNDGSPGIVATPPSSPAPSSTAPTYGPVYGPVYGAVPAAPGCVDGSCTPGAPFLGACPTCDPGMPGHPGMWYGFNDVGNRFYTNFEFLMWFVPDINTPLPLAQTSPNPFPFGAPFPAGTTNAIGSTDLISAFRLGGRFGAGLWFDPCHRNGLDANFFFIGPAHRDLVATATGANSLWRPYIVINPPIPPTPAPPPQRPNFADVVANVGDTGNIRVRTESLLLGADGNYRRRLLESCGHFADLLLGFRYLHLNESLTISETGTATPPNSNTPVTASLTDRFETTNNFYGWQFGVLVHKQWGPWSADLTLKCALGPTSSIVDISGSNDFGTNRNVGLFAQTSNIGRWQSTAFSVVPEVGVNLGYMIRPRMRVHIGYNGLYWSNIMQPGNQIDPIIDQTLVQFPPGFPVPAFQPLSPADPHPVVPMKRSNYFAHGINMGLTIRW
ncbi:MAG: BBP7 family outer membrane beta-barrel protein, partial [Gemmataceae bacterium]|nr:BBP7 family outer membrane beta-barrel protein [Gemmataceae bacterium]